MFQCIRNYEVLHIFVFINNRYFHIIKMVYYAPYQCLFVYCITSWGCAAKSHLIKTERAQRCILKVAQSRSILRPTFYKPLQVHESCQDLTRRQLFTLHTALRKYSVVANGVNLTNTKRCDMACPIKQFNTVQEFLCDSRNILLNEYKYIYI